MKLTGVGRVVLFLLVLGFGFGAFNYLRRSSGGSFKLPSLPGGNAGNSGITPSSGGSGATSGTGGVEIVLLTSASKKGWMQEEIEKFNQVNAGKFTVTTVFKETREAMHAILESGTRPALWSPSNSIWVTRLDDVWKQRTGKHLVNLDDSAAMKSYFRTPLVFVTTSSKVAFLKPRLGGSAGWQALRKLCSGKETAPWGKFRFACADPLSANSGLMTVGLMLFDFGQQGGMTQGFESLANSAGFVNYLKDLKGGLVFDADARAGSSPLFKAFLSDPGRYDVVTAYEANALEAAASHRSLAVIYPRPTAYSEHSVALLQADWVSAEQREGAKAFMAFLGGEESLRDGLKYHFRPVRETQSSTIKTEISSVSGQGFQWDFPVAELPPYKALNAANNQWRLNIGG